MYCYCAGYYLKLTLLNRRICAFPFPPHVNIYLIFVQGDLRDVLRLRKDILQAVLSHLKWKV